MWATLGELTHLSAGEGRSGKGSGREAGPGRASHPGLIAVLSHTPARVPSSHAFPSPEAGLGTQAPNQKN